MASTGKGFGLVGLLGRWRRGGAHPLVRDDVGSAGSTVLLEAMGLTVPYQSGVVSGQSSLLSGPTIAATGDLFIKGSVTATLSGPTVTTFTGLKEKWASLSATLSGPTPTVFTGVGPPRTATLSATLGGASVACGVGYGATPSSASAIAPFAAAMLDSTPGNQDTNYVGTGAQHVVLPLDSGSSLTHGLLTTDFSAIPAGNLVVDARLSLDYIYAWNIPTTDTYLTIHRVTSVWNPATVTWNTSDGTTPWTPGGNYDPIPVWAGPVPTTDPAPFVIQGQGLLSMVDGWVNGAPNNGMIVILHDDVNYGIGGYSDLYYAYVYANWTIAYVATNWPRSALQDITFTPFVNDAWLYSGPPRFGSLTATLAGASGTARGWNPAGGTTYATTLSALVASSATLHTAAAQLSWNDINGTYVTWNDGSTPDPVRALLKFDLSSIPSGKMVWSSVITIQESIQSGSPTMVVYRCLRPWTSSVTGDNYDGTNAWGAPGAGQAGVDYDPAPLLSVPITDIIPHFLDSLEIQDVIKNWINGTYPNYGFVLQGLVEANNGLGGSFDGPAYPSTAFRPQLSIGTTVAINGQNATLPAFGQTATAHAAADFSQAKTLPPFTQGATGVAIANGLQAATLAAFDQTATALFIPAGIVGVLDIALPDLSAVITGVLPVALATANQPFPMFTNGAGHGTLQRYGYDYFDPIGFTPFPGNDMLNNLPVGASAYGGGLEFIPGNVDMVYANASPTAPTGTVTTNRIIFRQGTQTILDVYCRVAARGAAVAPDTITVNGVAAVKVADLPDIEYGNINVSRWIVPIWTARTTDNFFHPAPVAMTWSTSPVIIVWANSTAVLGMAPGAQAVAQSAMGGIGANLQLPSAPSNALNRLLQFNVIEAPGNHYGLWDFSTTPNRVRLHLDYPSPTDGFRVVSYGYDAERTPVSAVGVSVQASFGAVQGGESYTETGSNARSLLSEIVAVLTITQHVVAAQTLDAFTNAARAVHGTGVMESLATFDTFAQVATGVYLPATSFVDARKTISPFYNLCAGNSFQAAHTAEPFYNTTRVFLPAVSDTVQFCGIYWDGTDYTPPLPSYHQGEGFSEFLNFTAVHAGDYAGGVTWPWTRNSIGIYGSNTTYGYDAGANATNMLPTSALEKTILLQRFVNADYSPDYVVTTFATLSWHAYILAAPTGGLLDIGKFKSTSFGVAPSAVAGSVGNRYAVQVDHDSASTSIYAGREYECWFRVDNSRNSISMELFGPGGTASGESIFYISTAGNYLFARVNGTIAIGGSSIGFAAGGLSGGDGYGHNFTEPSDRAYSASSFGYGVWNHLKLQYTMGLEGPQLWLNGVRVMRFHPYPVTKLRVPSDTASYLPSTMWNAPFLELKASSIEGYGYAAIDELLVTGGEPLSDSTNDGYETQAIGLMNYPAHRSIAGWRNTYSGMKSLKPYDYIVPTSPPSLTAEWPVFGAFTQIAEVSGGLLTIYTLQTIGVFTQDATGHASLYRIANQSANLPVFAQTATATTSAYMVQNATLSEIVQTAAAVVPPIVSAAQSATLPVIAQTATAANVAAAAQTTTLSPVAQTATAVGVASAVQTVTIGVVAQVATSAGIVTATHTLTIPVFTQAGTGVVTVAASAAQTAAAVAQVAVGTVQANAAQAALLSAFTQTAVMFNAFLRAGVQNITLDAFLNAVSGGTYERSPRTGYVSVTVNIGATSSSADTGYAFSTTDTGYVAVTPYTGAALVAEDTGYATFSASDAALISEL